MLGRRNIFLIGPMGSGKSAVGKLLARQLRAPYYDSDAEIAIVREAAEKAEAAG